jgi:hypothetical protein
MDLRRSFNGQDAAPTSAETAVRLRPRRSTVKALRVREVQPEEVAEVVTTGHYLHSMPAVVSRCFTVELDGCQVGAVVFSAGARNSHRLLAGALPRHVLTLARMWLHDDVPANGESRVLGIVLRQLRREGVVKAVVTFADPAAGHVGVIYRASGFTYLGQSPPGRYLLVAGQVVHPRTAYGRYGTSSSRHLQRTGIPAELVMVPGKYRYLTVLDPAWAWRRRRGTSGQDPPGVRADGMPNE